MMAKKITGTREWASNNLNFCLGCSHDCRMCYAKELAVRYKRCTPEEWSTEVINWAAVKKSRRKLNGRIMLPSAHDITPNLLDAALIVLRKVLEAGNEVLIVSKPHMVCIRTLCAELSAFKKQITFRFTIDGMTPSVLRYWEPGAPLFEERLKCLRYAFQEGFATSVSAEPLLEVDMLDDLVFHLMPFITDTIWIGLMNRIGQRVAIKTERDMKEVEKIVEGQKKHRIWEYYRRYMDNPKIRWKESIKKIVGLPLATRAGEDR